MGLRVLEYNYDVTNRTLIGDIQTFGSTTSIPEMTLKEKVIFRLTCYAAVSEAYVPYTGFSASDTFSAAVDTDYNRGTLPLMRASPASFNQVADWASVDPEAGKICFQLNAATMQLIDRLGTSSGIENGIVEIVTRVAGSTQISFAMQFNLRIRNLLDNSDMVSTTDWTRTGSTTLTSPTDYSALIVPESLIQVTIGGVDYLGVCVTCLFAGALSTITLSGVSLPAGTATALAYEVLPDAVPSSHYTRAEIDALVSGYYVQGNIESTWAFT